MNVLATIEAAPPPVLAGRGTPRSRPGGSSCPKIFQYSAMSDSHASQCGLVGSAVLHAAHRITGPVP